MNHKRRSSKTSTNVNIIANRKAVGQKELFLANKNNKQAMICLVSDILMMQNTDDDTDAAFSSKKSPTSVIGEDADFLILLLHNATDSGFNFY